MPGQDFAAKLAAMKAAKAAAAAAGAQAPEQAPEQEPAPAPADAPALAPAPRRAPASGAGNLSSSSSRSKADTKLPVQARGDRNIEGLSKAMADAGFETYQSKPITRLMAITSGQEKHGKTEWSFSAPAPLAVISFDAGTLRIVNKHSEQGRRIIPCWMTVSRKDTSSDHQRNWDQVQRAVDAVMADSSIRSLVIDTGTELWDLLRLKLFGRLEKVMPHNYVEANAEMRRFVKGIYDSRLDLVTVFPHKVKKEYKSDKKGDKDMWTGNYEFSGWTDFGFQADLIVRNWRDDEAEDGEPFKVTVKDCGPEAALNNMTFSGAEARIPALASIMYPNIDPRAWEDS